MCLLLPALFIWYSCHLEGIAMMQAYSHLKRILEDQNMTVPELHRRMRRRGMHVNLKSLYRLSNDQETLQRLDLRLAGALCEFFTLPLADLIAFEPPRKKLQRLASAKQKRLDSLMAKNSEGELAPAERDELTALVREAEEIMVANARQLAGQRRKLAPA
jgi:hypothetical protein